MIKPMLMLAVLLLGGRVLGADSVVQHSMTLKAPYAKVLEALNGHRADLVAATGAQVVQVSGSTFRIGADTMDFWLREGKTQPAKMRTVVTWSLVKPHGDMKSYKSVIDCYQAASGTVVRGSISLKVGERALGSRRLEEHVQLGVDRMQLKLKQLVGEQ